MGAKLIIKEPILTLSDDSDLEVIKEVKLETDTTKDESNETNEVNIPSKSNATEKEITPEDIENTDTESLYSETGDMKISTKVRQNQPHGLEDLEDLIFQDSE